MTKGRGSESVDSLVDVIAPGTIRKLLETGNLEEIRTICTEEDYSITPDDLDDIMQYLIPIISAPVISPLNKSPALIDDYNKRTISPDAQNFYMLFEHILPNLDAQTIDYSIQNYIQELIAICVFGPASFSELFTYEKLNKQAYQTITGTVFELFRNYNNSPEHLRDDKVLLIINDLIDNFLLKSKHLLDQKPKLLGQALLKWLDLVQKAPNESLSRSGGTASKIAMICHKLGETADLNQVDEYGNNALHLLMRSKLPTEEVNNLSTSFLRQGASCYKINSDGNSPLYYATTDLNFGTNIIEIMFNEGKIPVPVLRELLKQAQDDSTNSPYSAHIMLIVDALAQAKSFCNKETLELIAWIVKNSTPTNPGHPSYACSKDLHLPINYLLSDIRWNNFDLVLDGTSLWSMMSPSANAELIARLDSLSGVLNAFQSNDSLIIQLPLLLENLAAIIFTDKDACEQGIKTVEFLNFIHQNPQYIKDINGSFISRYFESNSTQRQHALLSAACLSKDSKAPFSIAASNLDANGYMFIRFILTTYANTSRTANELEDIEANISVNLAEALHPLSNMSAEQCGDFDQIITEVSACKSFTQALLVRALLVFEGRHNNQASQHNAVFLNQILKLNYANPLESDERQRLEACLTTQVMGLIDKLPTEQEAGLASIKQLLNTLRETSDDLFEGASALFGWKTFEQNLLDCFTAQVRARHGKNQFILNQLGLNEVAANNEAAPNSEQDQEQIQMQEVERETKFLGFGLFARARASVKTFAESPVLAKLLFNRDAESESAPSTSRSTPTIN